MFIVELSSCDYHSIFIVFKVSPATNVQLRDDRTETYLKAIRDHLNPTVQIVVTIFPTSRDDRYSAVKKLCYVEHPVPSQVRLDLAVTNFYCLAFEPIALKFVLSSRGAAYLNGEREGN